ncbi:MAG TPA: MG2 domain-containing protein, partial [Acidobacteriota bacterium]|nr:MG2 domain-containing protein [Acidobacteriota bacterium]
QALPRDSQVTVTFEAGLISTEGPLHATAPQSFSFRTFSPLKIVKTWQENQETQYQDGWWYELNNPLDEKSFSPDQIVVSPPLKYQEISVRDRRILIDGWKQEHPTYTVTFLPQLKDVFGQSLAGETQFSIQQTNFPSDFHLSGGRLVTIDPAGPPIARAYVRKHSKIRVKLFKVTPEDWPVFARIDATPSRNQNQVELNFPGQLLEDTELSLPNDPSQRYEVNIDLRPALTGAVGHAIVELSTQGENNQVNRSYQWLQVTQIAVEALQDPTHLLITSSQLQNGKPIGNALVTLFPSQTEIRTDHTGVALMELPLPTPESGTVAEYLVVRNGTDSALLQGRFFSGIEKDGWFRQPLKKRLNWFVFDDRSIYRPGEEVHFKGWIRAIESKPGGDITRINTQPTPLTFEVKDSASNTLATGHLTTNQFGGFDGKFRLPDSTALGSARIYFEIALPEAQTNADRQTHWHAFRVEEFRRPEFQVSIQPPAPLQIAGSSAELVAQATYFSGNGLSEAEVQWTIHTSETSYKPPNWDQFTFGK